MVKTSRAGLFLLMAFFLQSPNHPPRVKIIQPENNSLSAWNTVLPYSVEVSDAEDGESKFQEITSLEILVKLKFVDSKTKLEAYLRQKNLSDTAGLMNMVTSNCFSCHAVKAKLAGPSFQDISRKYASSVKNREVLAEHILKGSTGIWGKEVMPTHPELTKGVANQMIKWILNYSNDPDVNFSTGSQGSFSLIKPMNGASAGTLVMEAFYRDHGTSDFPEGKKTGADRILIRVSSRTTK